MKEAYLRGYYGYRNFGDEMLLFGLIDYLFTNYSLHKLIIEVGDKKRMDSRIKTNKELIDSDHINKIHTVEIKQHKRKRLTHFYNILGLGRYKKDFKFFGGGEVLSDERPCPHDGWNMPLLFNYSVRKGEFILLGGVGRVSKSRTKLLYKYLLPRAKEVILRDKTSYNLVEKEIKDKNKVKLYEDFSLEVMRKRKPEISDVSEKYILINISGGAYLHNGIHKIKNFCAKYPDHKKIFFPCDMNDDVNYYEKLKQELNGLEMRDRTQHSLNESLELLNNSQAGIGSRLHFLLPLKFFKKSLEAIIVAHKVQKMLDN